MVAGGFRDAEEHEQETDESDARVNVEEHSPVCNVVEEDRQQNTGQVIEQGSGRCEVASDLGLAELHVKYRGDMRSHGSSYAEEHDVAVEIADLFREEQQEQVNSDMQEKSWEDNAPPAY